MLGYIEMISSIYLHITEITIDVNWQSCLTILILSDGIDNAAANPPENCLYELTAMIYI